MQALGLKPDQTPNAPWDPIGQDALTRINKTRAELNTLESAVSAQNRRTKGVIIAVAIITILTGALGWRLKSELDTQGLSLSKLPTIAQSMESLRARVDAAENALTTLPTQWSAISTGMDGLDKKINVSVQSARRQSQEMAAQVTAKIQTEFTRRFGLVDEQISALQAQRQSDAARIETLTAELNTLRQDTDRQISSVQASVPRDLSSDVSALHTGLNRQEENIAAIHNQLERRRTNFEIVADNPLEVSPGMFLTIKHMDVDKQQVSGWLYVGPEHRTMWLRDQGVLDPIGFHNAGDSRQQEIVITRVTRGSAVGYVLTPREGVVATAAK